MNEVYDYIVIGSGPGGAPIANRLSQNGKYSVALIEAGGANQGARIDVPLLLISTMPRKSFANWAFETVPQAGLKGRKGYQPRGKGLGGSTAINALMYLRGHAQDYDEWADALGCPDWRYDDVLPYFKKSENNTEFCDAWHGQGGEMEVSALRTNNPWHNAIFDTFAYAGLPANPDMNGAQQYGYGRTQVMQKNGQRHSAAHAFVVPIMGTRPNLTVLLQTQATRLLIENRKVVGVEVVHRGQTRQIGVRSEVIAAAGAFQTPQLLMLSGIGDAAELQAHGIAVQHHLPQVGKNLSDHIDYVMAWRINDPKHLIGFTPRSLFNLAKNWQRYRRERRGMFATNYAEVTAFDKLHPDSPRPEVQYEVVIGVAANHGRTLVPWTGMSCHVLCLRPKSRGTVSLLSNDWRTAPRIDPAFLQHPDDIATLIEGSKRAHKAFTQSPNMAPHITHDVFTAHCRSDADWEDAIRSRADTNYHPVGTCRMGTDADAVVDARTLKVNGIDGLRISDASVMPAIVGGNTTAPTLMIGERCADMILQSL